MSETKSIREAIQGLRELGLCVSYDRSRRVYHCPIRGEERVISSIDGADEVRRQYLWDQAAERERRGLVAVEIEIVGGNPKACSRSWVKELTGLDPERGDGRAFLGNWIDPRRGDRRDWSREFRTAKAEGTLLLAGGSGGSHKNSSRSAVLLKVRRGAVGEREIEYQHYTWKGAELLVGSDHPFDLQAVLDRHPELAKFTSSDRRLPICEAYLAVKSE